MKKQSHWGIITEKVAIARTFIVHFILTKTYLEKERDFKKKKAHPSFGFSFRKGKNKTVVDYEINKGLLEEVNNILNFSL